MFRVTGLKILGRVGTHICLKLFFHRKPEKKVSPVNLGRVGGIFFIWPSVSLRIVLQQGISETVLYDE